MSTLYDTGIRPAIDEYLKKKSEEVRDYGSYWSASSAGYCMRKNIFERLGVPHVEKDSDNRTTRVFEAGHVFHEWLQRITKDAGLSIAQEVELLDDEFMIKGHFDDLVLVPFDNKANDEVTHDLDLPPHLILYDYKTAHSYWFEHVKGRPMSHYNRMQLGTYMYMLRNLKPGDKVNYEDGHLFMDKLGEFSSKGKNWVSKLTEARILKISKDDLRLHEIQLMWSEDLENEVMAYWTVLNQYWKDKQLPPCTCADIEINKKTGKGFMADPKYNPYFYEGEPCSIMWFQKYPEAAKKWRDA